MTNPDRVIRVFISSTFRDMHAERDHLVKFIFPQLRRLCEARGVTWGEVDLRWGVTDEAAAEGKVLPICMEEIGRCRPYFIGLLGERYGWVPQSIPAELMEKEAWLREQFEGRKSVTELEILHGVLRNPAMAGHAFFYFRDPAYVNSVPESDRKDFTAENAEDAEKLLKLKKGIRESGLLVRENYPTPETLGSLVLADLTAVIDRLFPEGSQPDPLTREALDHAAYARSRERVYVGRPESFARLDVYIAQASSLPGGTSGPPASDGQNLPLVILGESGSGKSALLANWAARYRRTHPDVFVLEHYIGATPGSADWAAMLRRIMGEFKQRLGLTQEIPEKPDALRSAFPNWLHMASAKVQSSGFRVPGSAEQDVGAASPPHVSGIVLILDALNQLEDRDGAPDLLWLPPVMPENVRLIVSTLPGRALDETTRRNWPAFKVGLLSVGERKKLICVFLHDYGRSLSPALVEQIAAAPQSANPLYLRVLLDELRLFGRDKELLEQRIAYYLQAVSPYELYQKVIARWKDDYGKDTTGKPTQIVGDTLSLLWAARRGLSESELLDALGHDGQPLPRAAWSPLFLAMADALVSRGGLLTFAHDFLRTAARDACLPTESHQQQAHIRLAALFERQSAGPRRTDELPWQLAEARAWQRLYNLLADRDFFTDAWSRNQFEVKTCWAQIEAGSPLRLVEAFRTQIEHSEVEADKNHVLRLSLLLADTGHPEEALRLRSMLVQHFRDTGDSNNLQATLGNQANILYSRGDLDAAMALYKEAERICRQLDDLDGIASSLCGQALIMRAHRDLSAAMSLHKEVERFYRRLGTPDGLHRSLGNQAAILLDCGDLNGAMALLKDVERLARQSGNLDTLSTTLGNQALIMRGRGDLAATMALHKEEERICRQLGTLDGLQRSLGNQALVLQARDDVAGAMALLKEQERICRHLGNLDSLSIAVFNQGRILQLCGHLDAAMALYKEVERICRKVSDPDGLQRALCNQAGILHMRGDLERAGALYKEQEKICRQLGISEGFVQSLANQAMVLAQAGRTQEGLPLVEEAHRLAVSHGYAALAGQIAPILNDLRQAVRGS